METTKTTCLNKPMKISLVGIFSYAGANATVGRHWPYFQKAGVPLWGIGRINTSCYWPNGVFHTTDIGMDSYVDGHNLCSRLVKALTCFLEDHYFHDYNDVCLIEYDSIFTGPLPEHPGGLATCIAGGNSPGFKGTRFFHTPWWADRPTAATIVEEGRKMLAEGDIEHGFPDRFLGRLVDRRPEIKVSETNTFSVNTIDRPEYVAQARAAIERGIWYAHGVKTPDQLKAVTEGLL